MKVLIFRNEVSKAYEVVDVTKINTGVQNPVSNYVVTNPLKRRHSLWLPSTSSYLNTLYPEPASYDPTKDKVIYAILLNSSY